MTTPAEALTAIRLLLNEPTAAAWSDPELRGYLNDALKDIARRTLCIRDKVTVTASASINEYALAATILHIDRIEWTPTGDTRKIPLTPRSYDSMDLMWGTHQDSITSDPRVYTTWGVPGPSPLGLKLKVYPTPHVGGNLVVFVRRLPTPIPINGSADSTQIELPQGWDEIAYDYVCYKAFRKDRQYETAMAHNQSYEERIGDMIELVDNYTSAYEEVTFDYWGEYLFDY